MLNSFPAWYRRVSTQPKSDIVAARWEAVKVVFANLRSSDVLDIVRLAGGRLPIRQELVENVNASLQEKDSAYPGGDRRMELAVIAGSVLALAMDKKDSRADAIALGLVCQASFRKEGLDAPPEFVDLARQHLTGVHQRPEGSPLSIPEVECPDASAPPGLPAQQQEFAKLCLSVRNLSQLLPRRLDIVHEHVEMLAWLMAMHSRDLDVPVASLPAGVRALVTGKELGDLVRVVPGPIARRGLLARALGDSSAVSVDMVDAVFNAPKEWRELFRGQDLLDLTPLTSCIAKSAEAGMNRKSLKAWAKSALSSSLGNTVAINASECIYLERLLAKASASSLG